MISVDLILVTSEDNRYLVKGGIGTAIGVFLDAVAFSQAWRRVDWITESPTKESFTERQKNVTRHYVSRFDTNRKMTLSQFAKAISKYVGDLIDARRTDSNNKRFIIEAADWEGLVADLFARINDPNVLKVSRLHTPLAVCSILNRLQQTPENIEQMDREREQLQASDLLSAPTKYIFSRTLSSVLCSHTKPPQTIFVPNCANVSRLGVDTTGRSDALSELKRLTGLTLPEDAFHLFVLGSVEIRKGSEIIQRSIPGLFTAIPGCHLTWIGHCAASGELTANEKVDADTFYAGIPQRWHDRVHLAGFIEHAKLPNVLPAGDMYAFCYLGDNFPGALLEVGLEGIPVAVLMRGGIPEMVLDGDEPLALAIYDGAGRSLEEQLIAAAMSVRGDPTTAKGRAERFRRHIVQKYAAGRVAEELLQKYERALLNKIRQSNASKSPVRPIELKSRSTIRGRHAGV